MVAAIGRELDARLATDEGFRSQVERWQNILAPLEDGDDAEIPPAGLFEKILNRIDEVGLQPPVTFHNAVPLRTGSCTRPVSPTGC